MRLDSDPQLATLLGLAATQITERYETQNALLRLREHNKKVLRFLSGHTDLVEIRPRFRSLSDTTANVT